VGEAGGAKGTARRGGTVSFLRKQESRKNNWIPAFARMTYKGAKKCMCPYYCSPQPTVSRQGAKGFIGHNQGAPRFS